MDNMNEYFSGDKLYGDDFKDEELIDWYNDEKEGFADLVTSEIALEDVQFFSSDFQHAWKYIDKTSFENVLGIGSASGYEFKGYKGRIKKLTILEPSDKFASDTVLGIPCQYVKPDISGKIPFADNSFDLITCIGVLHHIANVSFLINEMYRCTAPGGLVILREPIVSMGDWRVKRPGLTKRERGIPLKLFRQIISTAGFKIKRESLFSFTLTYKICNIIGVNGLNNWLITLIDKYICKIFSFNTHYHAKNIFEKLRPTAVYYILCK